MDVAEHASVLPPQLIAAYRRARYRIAATPAFELGLDLRSPELANLMRAQALWGAAFITAWNPLGARLSLLENRLRQQRLLADLQAGGLRPIEGCGLDADGAWGGEDSLLVLGLTRDRACALGRRHEQNAILWADADAIPRLLLLR
ncbi:MAG: DUF3293 domain-containing protein [Panacagrimonas sp.]